MYRQDKTLVTEEDIANATRADSIQCMMLQTL